MNCPTARRDPRRWPWLIVVAVLIALIVADRNGWLLVRHADDMATYHGARAQVVRVIDGDTIEIDIPDPREDRPVTRLRLWGVGCPELAKPHQPAEPFADEAAAMTHSLADGQVISLRLESHRTRGEYGRLLVHVELPDGSSLNEALLTGGYAEADDRWPHSLLGRYAQLQRTARRKALGFWSDTATIAQANKKD